MDKSINDTEAMLVEVEEAEDAIDESGYPNTSFLVAAKIMEEVKPGFVIIASPYMNTTEKGYSYPTSIGIVINTEQGYTRSVVADVLGLVVEQLKQEMDNIMEEVNGGKTNE